MRARIAGLLLRYLLLALAVVLLNFFIPRLLPGDPLSATSGTGMDAAVPLSATARAQLRDYYHLDRPLRQQFTAYLGDLASGDLGWSIARAAPVSHLIGQRLPWTLGLLLTALLLTTLLGTAAGIVAGWWPGGRRDRLLVSFAGALAAIPEFLAAIGLLILFAIWLRWFPLHGGRAVFSEQTGAPLDLLRQALDIGWHLTLPAAALVITGASGFLLLARDTTADLHQAPWLTVARAKGLGEGRIALRHLLPNALLPLLTYFGLRLGGLLGGALVIERVFGIPGLGLLAFDAIRARDYPVLQAVFLVASLGVLVVNLGVEFLYLHLHRSGGWQHD